MEEAQPSPEPVLISALNHYAFCPRRCALVHSDGVHGENAYLLEGLLIHRRVDQPGSEARRGVRTVFALPLFSVRLGLVGKADVVEFHAEPSGAEVPYPIDYKRGRRRRWDNDEIQLCAQALCLEEMLGRPVPGGAIYHEGSRARREVAFDGALRARTEQAVREARALLASRVLPPPVVHPRCDGCSVRDVCMPEAVADTTGIRRAAAELFDLSE